MKKITLLLSLCALVFSVMFVGCATSAQEPALGAEPTTKIVTDLTGKQVEIPVEVNRVCSSFEAMESVFVQLGIVNKNVAAVASNQENKWFIKVDPEIVNRPVVFASPTDVNLESLLALEPDVVFVAHVDMRDFLLEAKIPALFVQFTTAETVIEGLRLLGEVLGGDAQNISRMLIADYEANMALVKQKTDPIPKDQRPTVFYTAGGVLNTEAKGSIVTAWIEMAGGVNIAAENGIEGLFIDITLESLLEWDPDVIICRDASHKEEYYEDNRFANLSAVKNDRVYVNPMGVFKWSVRSSEGVLQPIWAATVIQPELFADLDVVPYVRDFYSKYYLYDCTDEEIREILFPTED